MTRFLHPASGVPQPYELVEAAATYLGGLAIFETALGGASNVFAHRAPETKPAGSGWLVVREVIQNGGRDEDESGLQACVFQVMAECPVSLPRVDKWHSAVQNRICEALLSADFDPNLELSSVAVPISRTAVAGPPVYDEASDSYYSVSEFSVTLSVPL